MTWSKLSVYFLIDLALWSVVSFCLHFLQQHNTLLHILKDDNCSTPDPMACSPGRYCSADWNNKIAGFYFTPRGIWSVSLEKNRSQISYSVSLEKNRSEISHSVSLEKNRSEISHSVSLEKNRSEVFAETSHLQCWRKVFTFKTDLTGVKSHFPSSSPTRDQRTGTPGLPCQAPGTLGSVPGLAGPASVYSVLWLRDIVNSICNICFRVAAHKTVYTDLSLWCNTALCGGVKQPSLFVGWLLNVPATC